MSRSSRSQHTQESFAVAWTKERYSASILEWDTADYFLAHQDTKHEPGETINSLVAP